MDEEYGSATVQRIKRHQFTLLLVGSIGIALFFVFIALSLYESSGTKPLDLSRPGYDEARKEAVKDNTVYRGFSADGDITEATLKEFFDLYQQKQKEAKSIDAFSGNALSDDALKLTPAQP